MGKKIEALIEREITSLEWQVEALKNENAELKKRVAARDERGFQLKRREPLEIMPFEERETAHAAQGV